MTLFRDDVGAYLALGGNRTLEGAREGLEGIVERRQAGQDEVRDPVVAAITRAQALDARRTYVRYQDGRYRELGTEEDRAAELFGRLDDAALRGFDRKTAQRTRELAEQYRARGG